MANSGVKVTISAADRASATLEKINKRIAGLQAPVRRAQAAFGRFASLSGLTRLKNGFVGVAREALGAFRYIGQIVPVLGAITGSASLAGMYRLVGAWGQFGTQLRTVSGSMGMAPQKLQAMQNAARLSGSSAEAMTGALQTLSQTRWKALHGMDPRALAQFKALGLNMKELEKLPMDQFFDRVAHSIRGLRDPVARTVAATALLGGAGEQLQTVLQETDKEWQRHRKEGERQSWMTKEMADRADAYRESQKDLTLSVEHFGDVIGDAASPALVDLNHFLTDLIDTNRDWIAQDIGNYVKQFSYWFRHGGWDRIKGDITGIAHATETVVNKLGGWQSVGNEILLTMEGLVALRIVRGIHAVATAFDAMAAAATAAADASAAASVAAGGKGGFGRVAGAALRGGGMLMRGGLYGALAYGEYKLLTGQPFRTGGGRDTVVNTGPLQKDIYDAGSAAAQKYGLDPDHFLALLQTESGGYDRTSKAGAFGPSQLMPATARSLGVADSVNAPNYDWRQNLDAGARYYKMQVDRFHGDYMAADAAYNAGPNSRAVQEYARTHIDAGLPSETQHYLASNAAIAAEMQRIRRTRDRLNATSGVATPPLFGGNTGDGGGNAPANVNVGISVHAPHGTKVQVTDAPPGTTVRPQIQTQRAMPPEITATGS